MVKCPMNRNFDNLKNFYLIIFKLIIKILNDRDDKVATLWKMEPCSDDEEKK